jgi:hypothetical protein
VKLILTLSTPMLRKFTLLTSANRSWKDPPDPTRDVMSKLSFLYA